MNSSGFVRIEIVGQFAQKLLAIKKKKMLYDTKNTTKVNLK